jgi:hypothetical protein
MELVDENNKKLMLFTAPVLFTIGKLKFMML